MRRWTLAALAGLVTVSWGSSFELYQDGAIYTFTPKNGFLGFVAKSASVECGVSRRTVAFAGNCPPSSRLCRLWNETQSVQQAVEHADRSMAYLDTLVGNTKPAHPKSETLIALAKRTGEARAAWEMEKRRNQRRLENLKKEFSRQAPSQTPKKVPDGCGEEVKLTLPAGSVHLDLLNVADISGETLKVTQLLGVKNRSGIDIAADEAFFYFRPMHHYLSPVRFDPWIVREKPIVKGVRSRRIGIPMAAQPMALERVAGADLSNVKRVAARHYRVKNLKLPSTGEEVDVPVDTWSVKAERYETVYPYRDPRVYKAMRFFPKHPLESDRWRIVEGKKVLTTNATGLFEEGQYVLFTDVDRDAVVRRERKILKEKESFFGGRVHKKDGYTLRLTNMSDRPKTVRVVDRIPVAPKANVEVKLLKVEGSVPVHHRLGEKGKLVMDVTIPAKKAERIDVLFEVAYDKKHPVVY